MPKCTTNCKCQAGGCDMPACTTNCKCQSGNCPMPACKRQCKCTLGGCFSSEQEEFLVAMERDNGAAAPISNQAPKQQLRGRPMPTPAAVPDQSNESLALLAHKYRLTAQALLKTASLAMDLSAVEDMDSMEEAKDQLLRALQVAESLGDDAADEAEEVLSSTESIHRKSNFPRTAEPKQTFYYGSGKAVQKSNKAARKTEQATNKAARKTQHATSKATHKTQQAINKADSKTESAIHKANYKTVSAVAKAETSAATSFLDAADALDSAAALTAEGVSIGTVEAVKAANLAVSEASNAVTVANASLNFAGEVAVNALFNW